MCTEWKANEKNGKTSEGEREWEREKERKVIWKKEKKLISMQVTGLDRKTGFELQKWKRSQLIYQNNRDIKTIWDYIVST